MADKKEEKMILEREYIIPLRRKFVKTPRHKRVPKAIKALKKFIAKHMKLIDRDLKRIKIDRYLNEELWFRGIKNPPAKIKVKLKKFDSGTVKVELAELSEKAKWKKSKEEKFKEKPEKKKVEKKEEKTEEKEEEAAKKETEEKEISTIEAGLKQADKEAREMKHEVKLKKEPKHQFRQALKK